ncbi:MAG: large conductance mechanosensitive channel protein MscL [Aestuariivirgaceae bacterium]|nr:large conductance mechanosensitive channel protein MscL [Aestuariivirgaceae bacterium]
MLKDFRQFALRGNVVDLAIGVIIGAAFGKIVESLVNDLMMPVIGAVTGGVDFSNYFAPLSGNVSATVLTQAREQGAVLAYGNFITVVVNFLIVAFVLFMVVRAISSAKAKFAAEEAAAVAAIPRSEELLTEIRDLLAKKPRKA